MRMRAAEPSIRAASLTPPTEVWALAAVDGIAGSLWEADQL